MSTDHTSSMTGTHSLLCGQRAKSYGSLVTSSPIRQKIIEHKVQPEDTLQGLSLKYGVSMEQIKRANRLYTNDSIFLKMFLSIPLPTESLFTNENELCDEELRQEERNSHQQVFTDNGQTGFKSQEVTPDLSPSDYLKRIDSLINQSKKAAVKACQMEDKQLFCTSKGSSAFCQCQQAMLGAAPLAITRRVKNLRDREDEIFQL
ncbi:lysM and putative peptidoglycan-binding domain-containing protein 1 [Electrophorus electricus]|uniref:LysM and putative peptidoglycan-binding domain-containing protein 1 n=1 Tax=Electrophorus electricus TaxID=8005 RepID=A0A4W4H9G9_ELEEL|nr:lysM and putative peptidoglycan-binding domain-containing protein 1 [Electrophorus electricus]